MESSSESADPLEGLDKSVLTLAGNSTKFALWDAKLGRQNEPFVAGLSSLSVDGGVISLMDVILEKVFPVAYMSADKGNRESPWGEEEERQRQDQWTVSAVRVLADLKERYQAESSRLQTEMRKRLELLEDVVGAVCSAAEGVEGRGEEDCDIAHTQARRQTTWNKSSNRFSSLKYPSMPDYVRWHRRP